MPFTRDDQGPLAILTLDNGDLNLFDRAAMEALIEHAHALATDPPRGLLVRAEGRMVSAGVDVHVFDDLDPQDAGEMWRRQLGAIQQIEDLPCPTVFAAHGLCLTAAFELALACDIIIASPRARFGLVERVVGLTPSMGGPQRLAERAGTSRAKELVYSGALYDAQTLAGWNVVNRIIDDAALAATARDLAMDFATGPSAAHAVTKTIIHTQAQRGTREADQIVPELSGALFATDDLRAAVRSFLADGPGHAAFNGR